MVVLPFNIYRSKIIENPSFEKLSFPFQSSTPVPVVYPILDLSFVAISQSKAADSAFPWTHRLDTMRAGPELRENVERVISPYVYEVVPVQGNVVVVPDTAVGDALEWVVDGEHDGSRPDLLQSAHQSRRGEVAGCRDEELGAEVVPD